MAREQAPRGTEGTVDPRQIGPGWDVYGADDEKVGDVSAATDGCLVVSKGFFFPEDRYIPAAAVARAGRDRVELNVPEADVDAAARDGPPETAAVGETRQAVAVGAADGRAGAGLNIMGDRGRVEGERTVRLREEGLRARKETVEAGAAEIREEVVAEQRTIGVPVTREEVVIERRPVDRIEAGRVGVGDLREGEVIRAPGMEEQVSVEKHAVVTEEIEVGRRTVRDTGRASGTVRREEVVVDGEGDVGISGDGPTGVARG